jgi:hypothetical protein
MRGREYSFVLGEKLVKQVEMKRRSGRVYALAVNLEDGDRRALEYVHRLVLSAFVGSCPEGLEGCHFDGNPFNNRLVNLRWDTRLANTHDSIRHGTKTAPPVLRGDASPNSKLTEAQRAEILDHPWSYRGCGVMFARKFGVGKSAIYELRRRSRLHAISKEIS